MFKEVKVQFHQYLQEERVFLHARYTKSTAERPNTNHQLVIADGVGQRRSQDAGDLE